MKNPITKHLAIFSLALFVPIIVLAQAVVATQPAQPQQGAVMSLFTQIVVPALFTTIAAIVTWGGAKLVALIDAKTKNETVAGVLSRLAAVVQTVVLDVNGTVKAAYLEKIKDGVLSDQDKKELKDLALAKIKEHLGKDGLKDLVNVLGLNGDLIDSFLGSHIEAAIEGSKAPARIDPAVSSTDPK